MDVKRVGWMLGVTAMVWGQSGCSFMFAKGPPANHVAVASFDCSESNGWPVVDTIWAGLNGLGAMTAAGDDTTPDQEQVVAVGVGWLLVSGISAIYGYSKVSECKAAKRGYSEERAPMRVPPPAVAEDCREAQARALAEARREPDRRERVRLINAAPRCAAVEPRAASAQPVQPAAVPSTAAPSTAAPSTAAPSTAAPSAPAPSTAAPPAPTSM